MDTAPRTYTVGELIAELSKYPADMGVEVGVGTRHEVDTWRMVSVQEAHGIEGHGVRDGVEHHGEEFRVVSITGEAP